MDWTMEATTKVDGDQACQPKINVQRNIIYDLFKTFDVLLVLTHLGCFISTLQPILWLCLLKHMYDVASI